MIPRSFRISQRESVAFHSISELGRGVVLGPGALEEASIERKALAATPRGWVDFTYHKGSKNKMKSLEYRVERSVGAIQVISSRAAPFRRNPEFRYFYYSLTATMSPKSP
jgi:hypothetical protein